MARSAAFFDLDRTLLRRSSALALAGSFRERGVISRRQLLQAAAWQLLCVARGARVIVEAIAEDLGFDGALGTVCEVRDGSYTGRALRALHAEAKTDCVRAVAESEGFDLLECTAYSDSRTDLPFIDAVGHPVAVNPDRELRRIARDRGRSEEHTSELQSLRHLVCRLLLEKKKKKKTINKNVTQAKENKINRS